MKRIPPLLFALAFLAYANNLAAKGIAALKAQHFHQNESAHVFVFEKVDVLPRIIRFTIKNRPQFYSVNISSPPTLEWVEILPQFYNDIKGDSTIAHYKKSLSECRTFTSKYEQSKDLLDPYMKILEGDITRFESGKVKHNGQWITRKSYEDMIKQKEKAEKYNNENPTITIQVDGFDELIIDAGIKGYKGVVVTDFTDDKVSISHSSGATTLYIEDVPSVIKKYLGMTEEKAAAYRKDNARRSEISNYRGKKNDLLAKGQIFFSGVIQQVVGDGLLLTDVSYHDGKVHKRQVVKTSSHKVQGSGPTTLSPRRKTRYQKRKTYSWVEYQNIKSMGDSFVFVQCDNDGLYENGKYEGKVYEVEPFSYVTVLGAKKTIRGFTEDSRKYLTHKKFDFDPSIEDELSQQAQ